MHTKNTDSLETSRVVRDGRGGIYVEKAGVGLLIDAPAGSVPAVLSWGPLLGIRSEAELSAAVTSLVPPIANNLLEVPDRMGILASAHEGYMGTPGVEGAFLDGSGFALRLVLESPDQVTLEENAEALSLVFPLLDREFGIEASVELLLDASGLLLSRVSITNSAQAIFRLERAHVALPIPHRASELLDFSGRWAREREPRRRPLLEGEHSRVNRRGRTGGDSAFVLHAGVPGFGFETGEIWALHVGFSGNHTHRAELTSSGQGSLGGGEHLLPGEMDLEPGETYVSPWIFASYGTGLNQVAGRFHSWLRALPEYRKGPRPVTINVWEAVYFNQNLHDLIALADQAAEVGVERFVLDDGWFSSRRDDTSGLGDWWVAEELWPSGLSPLVDHVRSKGMQFGIWFEPDMVNPNSVVAREHPEWIMAPSKDRMPPSSRNQQVLNLAIPEAFDHVYQAMHAIVEQYGVDYIKWDFNRDLIESGLQETGRAGVHDLTEASYRLISKLKTDFPNLEIEACASGGARVDLGIAALTDRVWASDCIDPKERAEINTWTTQLLPPEFIGSHIGSPRSHTTGREHTLAYRALPSMLFSLGIEWNLSSLSSAELEELGAWVALHKELRDLVAEGTWVRVPTTPDLMIMGAVANQGAVFACMYVDRSEFSVPGVVRFPGLESDALYAVSILSPSGIPSGFVTAGGAVGVESAADPAKVDRSSAASAPSEFRQDLGIHSGRFLAASGFALPICNPDSGFLIRFAKVDSPRG